MVADFSTAGGRNPRSAREGAVVLSSLVWTAMHAQYYDAFLFSEVLSIGLLLGYMRYRSNSTWLTIIMHAINNFAATLQSIWLAGQPMIVIPGRTRTCACEPRIETHTLLWIAGSREGAHPERRS